MRPSSSALRVSVIPMVAAALSLVRWAWQGTGNVWSKLGHKLYLADADLGWRRTNEGHTWLGLDSVAILVGVAAGLYLLGRAFENREGAATSWVRRAMTVGALSSLLIPLYAFAGGLPPSGAVESRPTTVMQAPTGGIDASLAGLPSGRYVTVQHPDSAVIAKLEAGGEVFDARFAGQLEGHWLADPADLSQPMQAVVSVAADSIDTGIDLRNQHARDDLKPSEFPQVVFKLSQLHSTSPAGENVSFAASGELALGGRTHAVDIVGSLRVIDRELANRLGLAGGRFVLLQAGFSLDLKETIIGNDGTFDVDDVPVSVTLILKHTEQKT